ncbi:MAG: hypothetical protein WD472_07995 [Dehalococcoidia bacterium]
MHEVLIIGSAFLASSVEMVEALTIILAVGVTRGWRSALLGMVTASVALTIIVYALGVSLVNVVPIHGLQVVVGCLLLIFGLQWLRKAVMRSSGLKAKHDEARIYKEEVEQLSPAATPIGGIDWTGFVVSFKGVFLEGLEVAFIIITFGAHSGSSLPLASAGAFVALVVVGVVGLIVHRPLTGVPENAIKYAVGIALCAFGTFWGAEGVGIEWTLKEPTIPILAGVYWAAAAAAIYFLTERPALPLVSEQGSGS